MASKERVVIDPDDVLAANERDMLRHALEAGAHTFREHARNVKVLAERAPDGTGLITKEGLVLMHELFAGYAAATDELLDRLERCSAVILHMREEERDDAV